MKRTLAFLIALLAGCYPDQSNPDLTPVKVYLSTTLLTSEQGFVRAELPFLGALGPRFIETTDRATADVVVTSWQSPDCSRIAGEAEVGGRIARIDFTCAAGEDAAMAFVGHEIGHALGMLHICRYGENAPGCSPTVYLWNTTQPAMMSPSPLAEAEGVIGTIGVTHPQREDLQEWTRVHPSGGL